VLLSASCHIRAHSQQRKMALTASRRPSTKLWKRVENCAVWDKLDITQSVFSRYDACCNETNITCGTSIKIVGEAELPGSPEAIQMMTDIKPEVLLLDLVLPEKRQFRFRDVTA
jgi:hypothetical protein